MNVQFAGFKENVLTFECDESVAAGDLVKMYSSGTVTKASNGDQFIGVCLATREGYAAIQLEGYIESAKFGAVNVGYNKLVSAAAGVKTSNDGIDRLVIYVDESTVGFIL